MYGHTEGDVDTPRTDSPVIFVLSDKVNKIHPHVSQYNLYSQPDWRASTKGNRGNTPHRPQSPVSGSLGGRGEYMVGDVIDRQRHLATRAPHRRKNKLAGCICDCLLTVINGFILPCLVLVGPAFLLFLLYNCYNKNSVTLLDVLYHYFPFLESSLKTLNQAYNKTKHQVERLDLLKVRTNNLSVHEVRGQESHNISAAFPRFQKQIFRPRSLDPTSTTKSPSNVILDNEMTNNATTVEPFAECNVILLPFLVFFCICLMIIYVMCKYKICAKDKNDLSEKEETQKQ